MNDSQESAATILDDQVLLDLADELHRLATGLKRSIRRNAVLPSLSELTAMRPLQAMLTETLSERVSRPQSVPTDVESEHPVQYEIPGYL